MGSARPGVDVSHALTMSPFPPIIAPNVCLVPFDHESHAAHVPFAGLHHNKMPSPRPQILPLHLQYPQGMQGDPGPVGMCC